MLNIFTLFQVDFSPIFGWKAMGFLSKQDLIARERSSSWSKLLAQLLQLQLWQNSPLAKQSQYLEKDEQYTCICETFKKSNKITVSSNQVWPLIFINGLRLLKTLTFDTDLSFYDLTKHKVFILYRRYDQIIIGKHTDWQNQYATQSSISTTGTCHHFVTDIFKPTIYNNPINDIRLHFF